jgi:hypothetical protein
MSKPRSNTAAFIFTGIAVVMCAVAVALLFLWTTARGGTPRTYQPFNAGYASALRANLLDGGPFYYADPFGGENGFWFALNGDAITAVAVSQPNLPGCAVRWRGTKGSFSDCRDNLIPLDQLSQYTVTLQSKKGQDLVYVDLRSQRVPADATTAPTAAPAMLPAPTTSR